MFKANESHTILIASKPVSIIHFVFVNNLRSHGILKEEGFVIIFEKQTQKIPIDLLY